MTKEAPHLRLHEFAVKHLHAILKICSGGNIGFDPYRNEQTNSKEKVIDYLLHHFTTDQIDAAHDEARSKYPKAPRRKKPRETVTVEAPVPAMVIEAEATEITTVDTADYRPETIAKPQLSAPQPSGDTAQQLAALLAKLGGEQLDMAKVEQLIQQKVAAAVQQMTMKHVISVPELDPVEVGTQHKHFSQLLKACNARLRDGSRLNIWLAGPAGAGKTTAAKAVAQALSLNFRFNGAIDQPYKLTGFVDAGGNYQTTSFRDAWENGGVYLFDEVDGSSPSATLEFNAALANGLAVFPDRPEPVERHADCIIIAGANTTGKGGTTDYVGRTRLDAAFLDRFVILDWPVDETLERTLCANVEWTSRVQSVRNRVTSNNIRNHIISPRATLYGEALLAAGLEQSAVESMTLRKGVSDADWSMMRG